jgi:hypothetical protein
MERISVAPYSARFLYTLIKTKGLVLLFGEGVIARKILVKFFPGDIHSITKTLCSNIYIHGHNGNMVFIHQILR